MPQPNPQPLEAILLDDLPPPRRPPRPWKAWLLAITAFIGFLVCSGIGLWGLSALVNLGQNAREGGSLINHWETPEERLTSISAATNAEDIGCSKAELRDLSRFFTRLMESLAAEDHEAFREQVDINLFARRASLHPWADEGGFSRLGLEDQLSYDLEGPDVWTSSISISHVVWSSRRDEALVYVVFADGSSAAMPFRWWLSRSGRSWKICDWEDLNLGTSEAARWAYVWVIDEQSNGSNYSTISNAITRAHEAIAQGDRAEARRELAAVSKVRVPELGHDMLLSELSLAWLRADSPDESLKVADALKQPELSPHIDYLRALAYEELDQPAEALAAAQRYRAAAGRHPEALQIEATFLEAQGKQEAAADCWWQVARLVPENYEALLNFCRLANEADRARIKEILARARKPIEAALQTGRWAAMEDNDNAVAAILDWLKEQPTGALAAAELTATQADHQGDYAAAADRYREAIGLASKDDDIQRLRRSFLSAMHSADKLVEGYQELKDARQAFELLTTGLDYDDAIVSGEDLPPLIASHETRDPDDPQLPYYRALVLMDEEKYAEAERQLIEGENRTEDEYLLEMHHEKRRECLFRQDKLGEALALGEDPSASFRRLASLCLDEGQLARLDRLLELYEREHADDSWLHYYWAMRHHRQGDNAMALAAIRRAESSADQVLETQLRYLKDTLLVATGSLSEVYNEGDEPKEAFARMAEWLSDGEHWDRVLELAQIHAAVLPSDPAGIYYASQARWHKQDYSGVATGLTPWPTTKLQEATYEQRAQLAQWQVRSLLRLNQPAEARAAGQRANDDDAEFLPLLMVEIHEENWEAASKMLQQPVVARDVWQRRLHDDPELAALLTEPALQSVRQQRALSIEHTFDGRESSIVLLLTEDADWEQLKSVVQQFAAGSEVRELDPPVDDPSRRSLLIPRGRETIAITMANRPYCDLEVLEELPALEDKLRDAIQKHAAWIAIDMLAPQHESALDAQQAGQQLAAALCGDDVLVVAAELAGAYGKRPVLADSTVKQQLEEALLFKPTVAWNGSETVIYESSPNQEDEEAWSRSWRDLQRKYSQLADRARVERAEGYGRVRIQFHRGHAQEDAWARVVRSKRSRSGTESLIAILTADSVLWPNLMDGTRVEVASYYPQEVEVDAE